MSNPIIIENEGHGCIPPEEILKYVNIELKFTTLHKNNITYSRELDKERIVVVFSEINYRDEFSAIETLNGNLDSEFTLYIYKK